MMSQPLIGFGSVWHRRLRPVQHAFSHASYFLMLPLRSLRALPAPALCRNRFGALSFHDRDHGEGGDDALAWIERVLATEGINDADGEIWLHTFPRVLGYAFKPVSFWFALRRDGSLAAVLAEVNNTFGQRHCYLLHGPALHWGREIEASKVFHVSPFCAVQGRYRFRFQWAGAASHANQHITAQIAHDDDEGALLQTRVGGRLLPLNAQNLRRAFFGTPLMTLGVVVRIHWHALRLALKGVSFHRAPPAPENFLSK